MSRPLRIGEDNICPITKLPCDDECCPPGAICNISGDAISADAQPAVNEIKKPLYTRHGFSVIYYDSQQNKSFMALTAKEAKKISVQYSLSGQELQDVLDNIKNRASMGELTCKEHGISEKTKNELIQLGYSVKQDDKTSAFLISWEEVESAFDANRIWTTKTLSHPAQNEQLKKEIWPEPKLDELYKENVRIQDESYKKSQREKAKYDAMSVATKIHEQTGYTSPGVKAVDELTETFGQVYKLLIADL